MSETLRQATLVFLVRDNEILLAMKKRGFGKGKLNGVGGKPESDETLTEAAIRECEEEIGVKPNVFGEVAVLDFFFPKDKSDWNQQVHAYLCTEWSGDPVETEEMSPEWYDMNKIPYDRMWVDDRHWLPRVLDGNFVNATFEFDDEENIVRQELHERPIST